MKSLAPFRPRPLRFNGVYKLLLLLLGESVFFLRQCGFLIYALHTSLDRIDFCVDPGSDRVWRADGSSSSGKRKTMVPPSETLKLLYVGGESEQYQWMDGRARHGGGRLSNMLHVFALTASIHAGWPARLCNDGDDGRKNEITFAKCVLLSRCPFPKLTSLIFGFVFLAVVVGDGGGFATFYSQRGTKNVYWCPLSLKAFMVQVT